MAYFLFNHANKDQKAGDIIQFLLRQVLGQVRGNFPSSIKEEYLRFSNDPHRMVPAARTWTMLLKDCIFQFADSYSSQLFVLIDAFDEFRSQENEMRERKRLCDFLREINETNEARLLITTRPEYRDDLLKTFPRTVMMEIKADCLDIDKYLDTRMQDEHVQTEVKVALKKAVTEASKEL